MTVYVDNMKAPFGRMKMSHMVADTHQELITMMNNVAAQHSWIQHPGTPKEHADLSMGKRRLAIQYGAQPITRQQLVALIRRKRGDML